MFGIIFYLAFCFLFNVLRYEILFCILFCLKTSTAFFKMNKFYLV